MGAHASRDEFGALQQFDKFASAPTLPDSFPELFSGSCLKYVSGTGKEAQFSKPYSKTPRSRGSKAGPPIQGHQHPRQATPGCAPKNEYREKAPLKTQPQSHGSHSVGDLIEIWSTSQQCWRQGSIDEIRGDLLHIVYSGHEGQTMLKIMPKNHDELRPPQGKDCPRPPTSPSPAPRAATSPRALPPAPRAPPAPPAPPPPPAATVPIDLSPIQGLHSELSSAPSPTQPAYQSVQIAPGRALGQLQPMMTPQLGSSPSSTAPAAILAQPTIPQNLQDGLLTGSQSAMLLARLHPEPISATPLNLASPCAAFADQRKKYVPVDVKNAVPLSPGVERLEPEVVQQLLQNGACALIDVRGEDRAAGLIPGAIHIQAVDSTPFYDKIPGMLQRFKSHSLVVFTCQYSAHRAPQCANWYREQADSRQRVAILSGGFRAWEGNGFPVHSGGGDSNAADVYALQQGVQFAKMGATPPKCAAALYAQLQR